MEDGQAKPVNRQAKGQKENVKNDQMEDGQAKQVSRQTDDIKDVKKECKQYTICIIIYVYITSTKF